MKYKNLTILCALIFSMLIIAILWHRQFVSKGRITFEFLLYFYVIYLFLTFPVQSFFFKNRKTIKSSLIWGVITGFITGILAWIIGESFYYPANDFFDNSGRYTILSYLKFNVIISSFVTLHFIMGGLSSMISCYFLNKMTAIDKVKK